MAVSGLTPSCSHMDIVLGRLRRLRILIPLFLVPLRRVFLIAIGLGGFDFLRDRFFVLCRNLQNAISL